MRISKPQRLAREVIYRSPWVNLYADRVQFPGGRLVDRHHVLSFAKQAVAILVEDAAGALLFVESYRYVIDAIQWEIPAGGIDAGEDTLVAAAREVLEESGYSTSDHRSVYTFYPIPGIGDKVHHIVHCRPVGTQSEYDTNEVRAVRWWTRAEVIDWVREGRCRDGFTLTALLWWLQM